MCGGPWARLWGVVHDLPPDGAGGEFGQVTGPTLEALRGGVARWARRLRHSDDPPGAQA
ncbi:hypothetical protein Sgleb_03670 [Streptomyces glebosus]|uniref:Uncharacterized protein n=1 Tax=Streptomyces glebosus TaxID=249580 RepID=A0A640SMV0_9ACTN|nr:hypothetical protein Sgleb_03670 [Streptomyces glebosus]